MALSPLDLALITARELSGNWVRSGLTLLGIFMGVAAVNATLNISAINNAQIQTQLEARDNPYLVLAIFPDGGFFSSELPKINEEDISVLQREVSGIG
ncbi:MAG: ABC transporter permease, partial [Cyanobacteria bacterium J06606_4]